MSEQTIHPYETHLNILFPQLAVIDLPKLVSGVTHPWFNQTLCQVNESVVRLGVVKGEYHWHKHDDLDEFFYVVEGRFLIDLDDRTRSGNRRLIRRSWRDVNYTIDRD